MGRISGWIFSSPDSITDWSKQLVDHGQHGLAGFLDGFDQIQLVVGEFANRAVAEEVGQSADRGEGFRRSCATMPRRRFLAVLAALNCVTSCLCCSVSRRFCKWCGGVRAPHGLEGLGQVVDTSGSEPFHHVVDSDLAVMKITGARASPCRARSVRQVSKPVMPGMITSSRTKSGLNCS